MTYVCITGNESNPADLLVRLEKVLNHQTLPLLAEIRLDFLRMDPTEALRFLATLPEHWSPRLIITQRLVASGVVARGQCRWDVPTWQSWWREVMQIRPWYAVDLDWLLVDELSGESLSWPLKFRSKHAFFSLHAPLAEIESRMEDFVSSARLHGVGVKVASPVYGARDLARLTHLRKRLEDLPIRIIVAMGQAGRAWRWSALAGNVSYFVLDAHSATAQGQETLEQVQPYLRDRRFPQLYVLWSTDALNRLGETEWNRVFLERGMQARYFNIPCSSEDFEPSQSEEQKRSWARDALFWMKEAKICGASITRPFKEVFPLALPLADLRSINTLYQSSKNLEEWKVANTDGTAVVGILQDRGVKSCILLGSGGTAQGLIPALERAGISFTLWKRNLEGVLPNLMIQADALVSTWPAEYQDFLITQLKGKWKICVDAQLRFSPEESPLAKWCLQRGVAYVSGMEWWKRQAFEQEKLWFQPKQSGASLLKKVLPLLPRSKSETIRALFLALARGGNTEIVSPSLSSDALATARAVEGLGAKIERYDTYWLVRPPQELRQPPKILDVKDCGALLRLLLPWSCLLPSGVFRVDAAPSLRLRPLKDFFHSMDLPISQAWPLEVPCGLPFPALVSSEQSSQFASGFLLATAAALRLQGLTEKSVEFKSLQISRPYLEMTRHMLEESGFTLVRRELGGDKERWALRRSEEATSSWSCEILWDASGLAFVELLSRRLSLDLSLPWESLALRQGDACFPDFLDKVIAQESCVLSLTDFPDLALPLWAAAVIWRRKLVIVNTPQLQWKESNRAAHVVELSRIMGLVAEVRDDGFCVDARGPILQEALVLPVKGDHRFAMSLAVIQFFHPQISPDDLSVVEKSFPKFLELCQIFRRASLL